MEKNGVPNPAKPRTPSLYTQSKPRAPIVSIPRLSPEPLVSIPSLSPEPLFSIPSLSPIFMAFPPWLGLISNVFLSLFISLPLSLCLFISVQGTEKEICLSVRGYPFIWSTTGHFLEKRISFYLVNQWTFPRGENILLSGQQLDIFQRRGYPYYLEPQLQHISQRRGYPYYLEPQLLDISQRRGYSFIWSTSGHFLEERIFCFCDLLYNKFNLVTGPNDKIIKPPPWKI